jgi:glycerophosphoryl diester phosphodiesterase
VRTFLPFLLALAAEAPAPAAPPVIVAHRGLEAGVPENTLAALRRSVARGVAVIELDVRATKDGQLVILHDETLDRTTDCSGRVADLTLARIRSCDAGWPTHTGERVPTLAEALDFIKTTPARLLLDIKPGTPLDEVLKQVRGHGAEAKVLLGLRRASDVARARAKLPAVTTLGFMPAVTDAAEFARAGVHIIRLWSDWILADPSHIGRVKSLGPEAWIMIGRKLPKSSSQWRVLHIRILGAGPDGLITDRPELADRP